LKRPANSLAVFFCAATQKQSTAAVRAVAESAPEHRRVALLVELFHWELFAVQAAPAQLAELG